MQYILTQQELDALAPIEEVVKRDTALEFAREKILSIAGFDCIHKHGGSNHNGYCDDCPCSRLANRENPIWRRTCGRRQDYSK